MKASHPHQAVAFAVTPAEKVQSTQIAGLQPASSFSWLTSGRSVLVHRSGLAPVMPQTYLPAVFNLPVSSGRNRASSVGWIQSTALRSPS